MLSGAESKAVSILVRVETELTLSKVVAADTELNITLVEDTARTFFHSLLLDE